MVSDPAGQKPEKKKRKQKERGKKQRGKATDGTDFSSWLWLVNSWLSWLLG